MKGPFERGQAGVRIGTEMDPQDRQVVRLEDARVAGGLGVDELTEGIGLVRDRAVGRVVSGQLDEPADRRATLVELSGRMEEARSVARGGGPLRPVAFGVREGGDRWPAARRRAG